MVEDVDGNRYLDFTSSVLIANTGHRHPKLVVALKEQLDESLHSYNFTNEWRVRLAEKLVAITPKELDRVFIVTTGAEAVEVATNAAKQSTGRTEVVGFWGGFHGKTYATLHYGGKASSRKGIGPVLPGAIHAPFPYAYRCPLGTKGAHDCDAHCYTFLLRLLEVEGTKDIAAVITEVFQGSAGQIEPQGPFVELLREWCTKNDVVLIFDEVQSSFGRSGKMFSFEHFGVVPDLLIVGKGIAGGVPLTAIVGTSKILDNLEPGTLSSTHGGTPFACRAAVETIKIIEEERLVENAARVGAGLFAELKKLGESSPVVGEVRGHGLMIGVEIVKDKGTREPSKELATKIMESCIKSGLMLIKPIGFYGNIIRIAPPLVLSETEARKGAEIIAEAVRRVT